MTTLAEFILTTREQLGYTQKGLAHRANLDVRIVEDIECGQELFLPPSIRQKLALALKVSAKRIKALEKQPETSIKDFEIADKTESIRLDILEKGLKGHKCPACGSELVCRVAVMYDLEDNMVRHPKAMCSKCPFQIK